MESDIDNIWGQMAIVDSIISQGSQIWLLYYFLACSFRNRHDKTDAAIKITIEQRLSQHLKLTYYQRNA